MPQQAIIDDKIQTVVSNTGATSLHVMCIYEGVVVNNPPVVSSPIFINVDQDTQYQFDPNIILGEMADIEGDSLWIVKIIETVNKGKITIGPDDILIMNNQVIEWSDFDKLKWTPLPGQFGANYTKVVIAVKDDGNPPRCYSLPIEIVFNVIGDNQEPTVSDSQIQINWGVEIVLTAALFTQDYYDPETNSLGHIEITSLPPAGEGILLINNVEAVSSDLPIIVTASQLLAGELKYKDTGEVIVGKDINITFNVFDNII